MNRLGHYLVIQDFKRNKAVTAALLGLMFLATLLMASGSLVIERLNGALDEVYQIARPPDYLVMTNDPYDTTAISRWSQASGLVKSHQVQELLVLPGQAISFQLSDGTSGNLSDSLIDHYFVTQNKTFDRLLDSNNQPAQVSPGEIGLPMEFVRRYGIQPGDQIRLRLGQSVFSFRVKGGLRDAQMSSSLASSVRFLIDPADFEKIARMNPPSEVIISFLLHQPGDLKAFQSLAAQTDAPLPANRITITRPLIQLINTLGDGLMSGLIILVGLILMSIGLMTIRLIVRSTLADDIREIGVLQAIGLTSQQIGGLYRRKYRYLAIISCFLASSLSFVLGPKLLANISLNFGLSESGGWTYGLPYLAGLIVYLIIMLTLNRSLRQIGKLSPVSALSAQRLPAEAAGERLVSQPIRLLFGNMSWAISLRDFRRQWRSWFGLTVVFGLSSLMLLLPLGMYQTITSPEFIKYYGAARTDIRMQIEAFDSQPDKLSAVEAALSQDDRVAAWEQIRLFTGRTDSPDGVVDFVIESGPYHHFPITMQSGRLPQTDHEIALSALNSDRLQQSLGNSLKVEIDGQTKSFQLVGIYQDITHGGISARLSGSPAGEAFQTGYLINLVSDDTTADLVADYANRFGFAKILDSRQFANQTMGSLIQGLRLALLAIVSMVSLTIMIISGLFVNLRCQQAKSQDTSLLAIGFTNRALRRMYLLKTLLSGLIGVGLALLITLSGGEALVGGLFRAIGLGLTQWQFLWQTVPLLIVGLGLPLGLGLALTWQVTRPLDSASVRSLIS